MHDSTVLLIDTRLVGNCAHYAIALQLAAVAAMMQVCDLKALTDIAHKHGAIVMVDNSIMTACYQRPLELGADISMISATKFVGGHSDVTGGILSFKDAELAKRCASSSGTLCLHSCVLAGRVGDTIPSACASDRIWQDVKPLCHADVLLQRSCAVARRACHLLARLHHIRNAKAHSLASFRLHDAHSILPLE